MSIDLSVLLNKYSPVGDICVLFICFILFVCLKKSFVVINDRTKIFISTIVFISLAVLSSLVFYAYARLGGNSVFTFALILTMIHILYVCIFHAYTMYMLDMTSLDAKIKKILMSAIIIVNAVPLALGVVFRLIDIHKCNVLNFNPRLEFFIVSYILSIIILAYILFKNNYSIIKPLRFALILVEIVCIFIMIVTIFNGNISFVNIIFIAPVIVVMYMTHSNPYNRNTGALAGDLFQYYFKREANHEIVYLCIKFYNFEQCDIPKELYNMLKSFWTDYFKNAHLFNIYYGTFLLAIKVKSNIDINEKLTAVSNIISDNMKQFNFDYKVVVLNSKNVNVTSSADLIKLLNSLFDKFQLNSTTICTDELYAKLRRVVYITKELSDIASNFDLNDDRVLVYCQPIKNVKLGIYNTAEALMRLNLSELGIIQPYEFVPILENLGIIHKFSMIILNKVCKFINSADGYSLSRISVNFSIDELKSDNFVSDFKEIICMNNTPYRKIGIEFTESTNDVEFIRIKKTIEELRNLGCTVYLDDFGTGYSNFDRLIGLSMNVVKFDRSLLLLAETELKITYLLTSFSDVFSKLGYEVLYEGVETDSQEKLCVLSNADYLQGYKYSKPIPIESLKEFLEKSDGR